MIHSNSIHTHPWYERSESPSSIWRTILVAVLAVVLLPQLPALAGTITGATTDLDSSPPTITINGLSFGAGFTEVFLVTDGVINGLSLISSGDTLVEAELPVDVGLGSYLLVVDSATGLAFFDVTIGAVSIDNVYQVTCPLGSPICSCDSADHVALGGGADCAPPFYIWKSAPVVGDPSSWAVGCDAGVPPIGFTVNCLRP